MKGMFFGYEQPFLWGKRCATYQKTAAEETIEWLVSLNIEVGNNQDYVRIFK